MLDVWKDGIDALRREGRLQGVTGSVLQEVVTDERLVDLFPGCRLFRIDSEIESKSHERLAIQRWYVLRPADERAYQVGRDEDVVALARAEETRLETEARALAFAGLALAATPKGVKRWGERDWLLEGEPRVILRLDSKDRLAAIVHVGREGEASFE